MNEQLIGIQINIAQNARAIGIENDGVIATGGGKDLIDGTGTAIGVDSAEAFGILNEGIIATGNGKDSIIGVGSATGESGSTVAGPVLAFGYSEIDTDPENAGTPSVLRTGRGNDEVSGTATAEGEGDVGAFGLVFTDADTGKGRDTLTGDAKATGVNVATANGIVVGVSNNPLLPDEAGVLLTGAGADTLTGAATATTVSDANDPDLLTEFTDANGVLVDLESTLDTGRGRDAITGTASAIDTGTGNDAVVADGIENRGTLLTRGGADVLTGIATASSAGGVLLTVAGGIDNGFGSTRNNIPVDPTISTGGGADSITGTGTVIAVGGIGLASGIETSGTIDTGAGADVIQGTGASTVTDGIRSVSDGVENATLLAGAGLINMGRGDDTMTAMATATGNGGLLDPDGEFGPETIGTAAEAIGIRNDFEDLVNDPALNESDGTINLGAGANEVTATATADSELGKAFAFGLRGGTINGGDEGNTITGTATATAGDDAAAFGLRFTNATFGSGNEVITGNATADGKGSSEVRAISVGVSDVDDDALSPPEIVARVGTMDTGAGNDRLDADAELTINAGEFDQVFFGGTNGIVVDGATEAQWRQVVEANAQDLADAVNSGERFAFTNAVQPLLAQLDTSTLTTGAGVDTLDVTVTFEGSGADFVPEDDLEFIADAVENAGLLDLGEDNDVINITMDARSTVEGAKMLVDPLDNSSVGLITGYAAIADQILTDAGLIGEDVVIDVEVNDSALFDLGEGDDMITTNTFATALDDLSAGDGLGNRGLWVGGNGSETLDLTTVSVFRIGEVELTDGVVTDDEQREGIADGWESRRKVFLDDIEIDVNGEIVAGDIALDGNDTVKADATAFGNGVLTISDGYEAREFTDTGAGNDTFDLTARAFTTQVDATNLGQVTVLADNTTVASGLMTEQVDEGDFFMKQGNDTVLGEAFAAPALGLDPFAFVGATFDAAAYAATIDPAALPAGFVNRTTIAQGISQVSGDADNDGSTAATDPTVDLGDIDTGEGIDTLDGDAIAIGVSDVQAYGILLTQAVTGTGGDILNGDAQATGLNVAEANGLSVGISNNTDNDGVEIRADQAGSLDTGEGADILTMSAVASTATDGTARVATGIGDGTVVVSDANADANGVLVDLDSTLDLGGGANTITATADAIDEGTGGADIVAANLAVTADGIENRGTMLSGDENDVITGTATAEAGAGVLLTVAGGIDNGFGSTRNNIEVEPLLETGGGNDELVGSGTVTALGGIGLASGIETSGTINTGDGHDVLDGTGISTVTDGIRAVADGIENSDLIGAGTGGLINTGIGNDALIANATAEGFGTDAEAIGIRNDFEDLVNDPALNESDGTIELGAGDDEVTADANAMSDSGTATAIGIKGGTIFTGADDDSLTATATATSAHNVGNADGVFVDVDGTLNTGAGNDAVTGTATASGVGGTGGVVVADGVENRETLFTGVGNDVVTGTGVAHADGTNAIAGGIDNGVGGSIGGPTLSPALNTDDNDDQVIGSAIASAENADAISDGIENVGTITTGAGSDVIEADAFSHVTGTAEDRSIADGIDNGDVGLITTGGGDDQILVGAVDFENDVFEFGSVATANGHARAFADGIDNEGTINLVGGNDVIEAAAQATAAGNDAEAIAIRNEGGVINLGGDNDTVLAFAEASSDDPHAEVTAIGIRGGTINGGAGDDVIAAASNDLLVGDNHVELAGGRGFGADEFGADVNINMQGGDDFLFGFGEAVANGGGNSAQGGDELAFAFSLHDFLDGGGAITKGNKSINEVSFAFGGETLESTRFELFTFDGETLGFGDLPIA